VGDQDQRATRDEQVIDGLGNLQPPNPVKRLSEGDRSLRAEAQRCGIFRDPPQPAHVGHSRLLAAPLARLQHAGLGIKRRHLVEQPGQGKLQDARPAAHIEQLAGPIKRQLPSHRVRQLRGIRRTPDRVVLGRPFKRLGIERRW
jgi:hypothetical protein